MPVTYDQIHAEPALYLSQRPFIPQDDVTLIFGPGAIGKGRMVASWTAAVTQGLPVGMDSEPGEPGDVITIMSEDRPGRDMVPRLTAAGADLTRVHDMTRLDGGGRFELSATPKERGHLAQLRGYIDQLTGEGGNPRMVVIDPVSKIIGWGNITTKQGANYLTETLQDFAEEACVAVILVAHTTKAGVLEGSAGMMQGPRVVYRVAADPANDALRVLSVEKANNLPDTEDLRFAIREDDAGIVGVEWLDREKMDAQRETKRAAFLDRLAERRAAKAIKAAQKAHPGLYEARCTVNGATFTLAAGVPAVEAQEACQRQAGPTPLAWKPGGDGFTAGDKWAAYTVTPQEQAKEMTR